MSFASVIPQLPPSGWAFREPLPERGNVEDRDPSNLAEAQEVGVGTDHVVRLARYCAFEELVVCGIPAHANRDIRTNERGPTLESNQHSSSLAWRHSEFSQHVRAHGHRVDFGEDLLGNEEDELVGSPRLVDASREALGTRERAPQEDLSVKNDFGPGQRAPLRR